jgi:membrane protein DedA with SNARE-associated domain
MLDRVIERLGYVGLYLVLGLAGLGLPVPEELPILSAGALSHCGYLRWWIALPVCVAGALTGDAILYWLGHHWGDRVLSLRLARHLLTPERREQFAAAYRRRGALIVIAARHVIGVRAAAFLTAGIVRLPFWKFLAADGLAAGVGIPISFTIAYLFTDHLRDVIENVHRVERWLGLIALVALAAWFGRGALRRSRRLLLESGAPLDVAAADWRGLGQR